MKSLAVKNLKGKPVRTAVLILLSALLTAAVFGASVIVSSLRTGLGSLENRLGADIMVVPYEATTQKKFENIVLQGATGYFYMDNKRAEQVMQTEGIKQASAQYFLASTSSSCCSVAVQIIGFDPETDFTITPWVKKSYGSQLKKYDVVVGNDLNAFVGDSIQFFGVECHVAAKLERTGTSFDTAAFTNTETIKELINTSVVKKMNSVGDVDPESAVSCLMINVAEGYTPEQVVNDINLHVKKVKAIRSEELISGVSQSLDGVCEVIGIMTAAVWLLGLVILILAFTMSINERKKEFAVLRVIGASRAGLAGIVLKEACLSCLLGSVVGAGLGLLVIIPFNGFIEQLMGLPFLLPGAGEVVKYILAALALSVISGALAAAVSALRVSRIDTGVILRGDN